MNIVVGGAFYSENDLGKLLKVKGNVKAILDSNGKRYFSIQHADNINLKYYTVFDLKDLDTILNQIQINDFVEIEGKIVQDTLAGSIDDISLISKNLGVIIDFDIKKFPTLEGVQFKGEKISVHELQTLTVNNLGELTEDTFSNDDYQDRFFRKTEKKNISWLNNFMGEFTIIVKKKDGLIEDTYIQAIENFSQLNATSKDKFISELYDNYKESSKVSSNCPILNIDGNISQILEYIQITSIIITKYTENDEIFVVIMANCERDEEHGLQIVFKNGNNLIEIKEQEYEFLQ